MGFQPMDSSSNSQPATDDCTECTEREVGTENRHRYPSTPSDPMPRGAIGNLFSTKDFTEEHR